MYDRIPARVNTCWQLINLPVIYAKLCVHLIKISVYVTQAAAVVDVNVYLTLLRAIHSSPVFVGLYWSTSADVGYLCIVVIPRACVLSRQNTLSVSVSFRRFVKAVTS